MNNQISYSATAAINQSSEESVVYQGWQFSPNGDISFVYLQGGQAPDQINVNVSIENYPALDALGQYSEYRVRRETQYTTANPTGTEFVGVTSAIPELPAYYTLTQSNLEVNVAIGIVELGFLQPGGYRASIKLKVFGVIAGGTALEFIEERELIVRLIVIDSDGGILNAIDLDYQYVQGLPLPEGQLVTLLSNNSWSFKLPEFFDVVSPLGEINFDSITSGVKTYIGQGTQELLITLNTLATTRDIGFTNVLFMVVPDGAQERWLSVGVNHFDTDEIRISAEELFFTGIRNIEDPLPQRITVLSGLPYTIIAPSWLLVEQYFFNDNQLEITPAAAVNFAPGIYVGVVTLVSDNDEDSFSVIYTVVESVTFSISNQLNFCEDETAISMFYASNTDSRAILHLNALLPAGEFEPSIPQDLEYELAFFNNRCKFHIGDTIKRLVVWQEDPFAYGILEGLLLGFSTTHQYDIFINADVLIEIPPAAVGYEEIIRSIDNAIYVPGRPPALNQTNIKILKPTATPIRVTRKSKQLLNIGASANILATIARFRNGTAVLEFSEGSIEVATTVVCRPLYFNMFSPGDSINVMVNTLLLSTANPVAQEYIVFPDAHISNHVMWVTENNVFELYEFTGEFSINTEIEQIIVNSYKEVVRYLEKLDTEKEIDITLNSGWTLKSNQVILEEIGVSKKAWIIFEGSEDPIEVIPVPATLESEDSSRGLYAYDLNFKINPSNALRNYTS